MNVKQGGWLFVCGPKCMKIVYAPLAEARRGNRAQTQEWLTTYTRLFTDLTALTSRLTAAGNPYSPASPSPEHLRKRLDRHFAPGSDGFQAVVEMREAKLALGNELAAAQDRLKGTLQDTRRRWRNLGVSFRQTATSKTALLEFVEQTCLVELSPEQQQELRALAATALQTFSLPEVTQEAPPGDVTSDMLAGPEAHLAYERWEGEMDELIDKAAVHSDQPDIQAMGNELRQLRRSGT